MIDEIKGNLRNNKDYIIKIRVRDTRGLPQHKAEFKVSDKDCLVRELRLLKEKFGANCISLDKNKEEVINQERKEIEDEMKHLDDWRKRTRGLREPDKEFQEKVKKIL